jgi:hypothetical protein
MNFACSRQRGRWKEYQAYVLYTVDTGRDPGGCRNNDSQEAILYLRMTVWQACVLCVLSDLGVLYNPGARDDWDMSSLVTISHPYRHPPPPPIPSAVILYPVS